MHNTKNSYLSLPPEEPNRPWRPSEPGDEPADQRVPGAPASGRIVLLAVVMLGALGAAGLLFMYNSVHRDDAKNLGALERQGASPVETIVASAPLPPSALPSTGAAPLASATVVAAESLPPANDAPASARPALVAIPARPALVAVPVRPKVQATPVVHHVRTRPVEPPAPVVDLPAQEPAQTAVPTAADSNPVDDAPAKPAAAGEDLFDSRK